MPEKYWMSPPPKKCEVGGEPIRRTFIDGVVRGQGWACMCPTCHRRYGNGLGIGRGQKYRYRKEDDKWVKVEG